MGVDLHSSMNLFVVDRDTYKLRLNMGAQSFMYSKLLKKACSIGVIVLEIMHRLYPGNISTIAWNPKEREKETHNRKEWELVRTQ